ncbi:MFS transporter [Streptacidiphilus anmyonensis]|uniref:MFS transporter n=1 Tax=Streptacidiphilus anmyonensis TaxID=405782 RepID=UPI000693C6F5|nr:MFS transporter [Streptacidiphilus anmyonensis]
MSTTTRPATGLRDTAVPARWRPRDRALLLVLAGNMLIDALEVSVVLVALPAVRSALGLSVGGAQATVSGFALGFAALLLLGPRITTRFGRRRVYLASLPVFVLASVVGGLAADGPVLIASRVVTGACAALTAPTGLAIVSTAFPEGEERRRAVSVYSMFGAAGFTVGLLAAGAIGGPGWRWDLVLPALVAVPLFLVGLRILPADDASVRQGARPGTALLRHRPLLRSALGAATLNGGYLGLLLLLTLRLAADGWGTWRTALAFLPACLPLALSLPFAGRLVARFGAPRLVAAGAVAAACGQALCLRPGALDDYATGVLPALLLIGAAFVLSFAALNFQAMAAIPVELRGAAAPLYQAGVQLGAALVLPTVAGLLATSGGDAAARVLLTSVAVAGAVTALTGLRPSRREST